MIWKGEDGMKQNLLVMCIILLLIIGCGNSNSQYSKKEKGKTMHKFTNKLINEKSPYLQQHAHNPVDWYPWGNEAFEKAKQENKPIFLSIGYATCHWCHVMEHESFEDEEVAELMNDAFVSIKVDREERPDIDNVYMTACQMLTRSGGWPLTIIMTPDKKPFFAGTYIPKSSRFGRVGMMDLVPKIKKLWATDKERLVSSAEEISKHLKTTMTLSYGIKGKVDDKMFNRAFDDLKDEFDSKYGGFGEHPKFPTPHRLIFLLRYWKKTGNEKALAMAEFTLRKMREGGIFDHLGHGFHRYSTDAKWLLPHFEKMLYDQALLIMAYTEAYSATKEAVYKETADEIIDYILRDMTSSEGGFYSAEDADSEGEEGKFYVWEYDELESLLTDDEFSLLKKYYDIEKGGNFHDEATGEATGKIIINLKDYPIQNQVDKASLEGIRQKLVTVREKRIHPLKDTKILTDWNGLMIVALANAGRYLDKPEYTEAAVKSANFILSKMRDDSGGLMHRYKDGDIKVRGMLDDYAFLIWGLIELYEATFEVRYLKEALALNEIMVDRFGDDKNGGFFMTGDNAEVLLVRPKEIYDGAIPSGNSAAFMVLMKLALITGETRFEELAVKLENEFAIQAERSPSNFSLFLCASLLAAGPSYEIVVAGKKGDKQTEQLVEEIYNQYIPEKVVVFRPEGEDPEITKLAAYTKLQTMLDGLPTVYICQDKNCQQPVTSLAELKQLLKGK